MLGLEPHLACVGCGHSGILPSQPWQKAASRSWCPTAAAGTAFEKPRPAPAVKRKSPCSSHHCSKPINVAINQWELKSMASDPAYDPAGRVSTFTKLALPLEESGVLLAPCCSSRHLAQSQRTSSCSAGIAWLCHTRIARLMRFCAAMPKTSKPGFRMFQGWLQPNSKGDVAVIATLLVSFPRRTSASLGQRRASGPDTERGLM